MSNEELPPPIPSSESEISEEDKKIILQIINLVLEKREEEKFNLMGELSLAVINTLENNSALKKMTPTDRTAKREFYHTEATKEIKNSYPELYSEYLSKKEATQERFRGLHLNGEEYLHTHYSSKHKKSPKENNSSVPDWVVEDARRKSLKNPPKSENE